jgi:chitinase
MTSRIIRILTIVFSIAILATSGSRADDPIVLGYYMAWSKSSFPHTAVPYDQVTHIAHAFVWPRANGTLDTYSYFFYPELVQWARDEDKKMILSIGGWGNSDGFGPMAADEVSRARFVDGITTFCLENGYDGIDLDWEYPGSADRQNFVKLVQELRESFSGQEPPLSISIALPSSDWRNGYDILALRDLVDYFGVMTYDFHGSWTSHSGHNSPLYPPPSHLCQDGSLHQSVNYYLQRGVPATKLVVGGASYGRRFNTADLYQPPTSPTNNGAAVSYADAMKLIDQGWAYHWDDISKAPYLKNPVSTQIVSFDDTVSFRYKAEYIQANNLRGVKVWALGYDFTGNGHPLMETLATHLLSVTEIRNSQQEDTPDNFRLLQNYPNPFNNRTMIKYLIDTYNAEITLRVFDMLGRKVTTLVDKRLDAGSYIVEFSPGNSIPSGVYMYRLDVDGHTNVKNMIYLK